MNYNVVYFSPTYTTRKIVKLIASHFGTEICEFDITDHFNDTESLMFNKNDFIVIGIPVYSGRVPKLAKTIIAQMNGNDTPIALVATYGNRHYDDSLLELKTILQAKGFIVIAAAAFVTEHSVVRKFGKGRPSNDDIIIIHDFAKDLHRKISLWNKENHQDLEVSGNIEYRKYQSIPIKPHTSERCSNCGLCAKKCPAGAILPTNPKRTNKDKCVTCMRCIHICPQKARDFYRIEKFIAEKSLSKLCKEYKRPEIFI